MAGFSNFIKPFRNNDGPTCFTLAGHKTERNTINTQGAKLKVCTQTDLASYKKVSYVDGFFNP